MGRLHKKKLAEYAEETDDLNKSNEKGSVDGQKSATVESGSESGDDHEGNAVKNTSVNEQVNSAEEDDADEDFKSLQGDDDAQEAEKEGRKTHKRKAAEKVTKNGSDDDADGSDDEPLSGGGSPKKGRKVATGKGKTVAKNGKAGGGTRKAKKSQKKQQQNEEQDDEEAEEEYEVKDIVDHKIERGVSYFLIRWKGYTKDDDTWEPEDTLSCPDIIEKFKKKQSANGKSPKKVATPAKRGRPVAKEDPNKEWEVDKIIDYAEEKGGRLFRIRWKGFGPKHDTWEPEENLYCDEIIDKFMKRMKTQENVSFKELREEPKKTKRLVNETSPRTNYHNKIGRSSKRSVTRKR